VQQETGIKGKDFFHPVRLALTNREDGPELPVVMAVLLRLETVKEKLRKIIE